MKRIVVLLILVGLGWGVYHLLSGGALRGVLDRTSPRIVLPTTTRGVGNEEVTIPVGLYDDGAGLGRVIVQVTQNGQTREVVQRTFDAGRSEEALEVPLSARTLGLTDGPAELRVEVFDGSVWGSRAESVYLLTVDYSRPKIDVLTLQHVAVGAGSEFVIYRASDSNLAASGVVVGETEFPGLPLSDISPGTPASSGVYGALFAFPIEGRPSEGVAVFARDNAGNTARFPLTFRVDPGKTVPVNSKLTIAFLEAKMPELMDKFLTDSGTTERPDLSTVEGLRASFRLINEDYRTLLNEKLRRLFEGPVTPRRWTDEVFLKPMPAATSSVFGEQRTYSLDGVTVSSSFHNGVDLASTGNAPVVAVQDGTVVLAEDLGIYGNTVVIDHGVGLFSLYGHLAGIVVDSGATVTRGQLIGQTGTTGLAGGDHLHFEFRVRNVPVVPIEWWDPKWLTDNFGGKIAAVRQILAVGADPA